MWSLQQINTLITLRNQKESFQNISKAIPPFTPSQCKYKFYIITNKPIHPNRWNKNHTQTLKSLLSSHSFPNQIFFQTFPKFTTSFITNKVLSLYFDFNLFIIHYNNYWSWNDLSFYFNRTITFLKYQLKKFFTSFFWTPQNITKLINTYNLYPNNWTTISNTLNHSQSACISAFYRYKHVF